MYDVAVIGAGPAGLICARNAARRGLSVALVDRHDRPGVKLSMAGGGRGNFTNRTLSEEHYVTDDPSLVRAVLRAIRRFARENRRMLSSMVGDVFGGNEKILAFISRNFTRHVSVLFAQLERAHKEGLLRVPDPLSAMLLLAPPVVFPQVLAGLSERITFPWPPKVKKALRELTSGDGDGRIDLLLDAVFKGEK